MKPEDTKGAIEQLIADIQYNEWYCTDEYSESELEYWEKDLIVTGLRKLLEEFELLCAGCGSVIDFKGYDDDYCPYCGQKLDWSEE